MDQTDILLTLGLTFTEITAVVLGLLAFIVALGLAVFIHELGHFLAAKLFRVPVERFVIGMDKEAMPFLPRCIWERQIGETVYGLSLVPLGGYVKMSGVVHPEIEKYLEGEESEKDDKKQSEEPLRSEQVRPDGTAAAPSSDKNTLQGQAMQDMAALYKKPFWQKIIIYGAGVFMNLVLATVAMAFLFAKGFEENAPLPAEIAWISPDSRFADTKLETGDLILAVDGTEISNSEEMFQAFSAAMAEKQESGGAVEFKLARQNPEPGEAKTYTYEVPSSSLQEDEGFGEEFSEVFYRQPAYIDRVLPNEPADDAGLQDGDFVRRIDDEKIVDFTHLRHRVLPAAGEELEFVVERDGEMLSKTVTPAEHPDLPGKGLIGILPGNPQKHLTKEPIGAAITQAPGRVYTTTSRYLGKLKELGGKLTRGNVDAVRRELGGPVGIAQIAYRQAQRGFNDWLDFLIILNVALAVMNILPFPVLDGGHICFAIYEAIFRKPVPPKILVPLLNGAVMFILIFFVLVTFNDLFKIFV